VNLLHVLVSLTQVAEPGNALTAWAILGTVFKSHGGRQGIRLGSVLRRVLDAAVETSRDKHGPVEVKEAALAFLESSSRDPRFAEAKATV
jgi:hypothetical protein